MIRELCIRSTNLIQMLLPPVLREDWEITEEEWFTFSEPMAASLAELPPDALALAAEAFRFANPLAAAGAAFAIIAPRVLMTRAKVQYFREQQRGTIPPNPGFQASTAGQPADTAAASTVEPAAASANGVSDVYSNNLRFYAPPGPGVPNG